MPSRIEELLAGRHNDRIDLDFIRDNYGWILERDRYCVLSPDSDGFLCGLFMSFYKNWKIVGFYDDKVSVIHNNHLDKDLVFLDGEIYRKNIKSFGHHMLSLNKNNIPNSWDNFENCIQPNLLRNFDGKHDFRLKYPLATIHMLVTIISYFDRDIHLDADAIPPLFFTDGVFNVLFSYPENVLNWLKYLRVDEDWNPLKNIFENDTFSIYSIMVEMNSFFRERDEISIPNQRGDRLRLSERNGESVNIVFQNGSFHIDEDAATRAIAFISLLGGLTQWEYISDNWSCWENLSFFKFTKRDFKSAGRTLTNSNFMEMLNQMPLSWAMTSNDNIEYTLEEPSSFDFINEDND